LLASVSDEDQVRLLPHLQPVKLSLGDVLHECNGRAPFAYFPTTCVVSLVCPLENGTCAEVAVTGRDGVVGTSAVLGDSATSNRAIVGVEGEALRVEARIVKDRFKQGGSFQKAMLYYLESLITQISLTAACNRMHTLEKRLCRWLLLIRDRTSFDEFTLTQEFISHMLGGRRETVTVAAGRLQDAGLIEYRRGHLRILDREGLENAVCECYRALGPEHPLPQQHHSVRELICSARTTNALR
jgi:CRP-like cAMP-binding protein